VIWGNETSSLQGTREAGGHGLRHITQSKALACTICTGSDFYNSFQPLLIDAQNFQLEIHIPSAIELPFLILRVSHPATNIAKFSGVVIVMSSNVWQSLFFF